LRYLVAGLDHLVLGGEVDPQLEPVCPLEMLLAQREIERDRDSPREADKEERDPGTERKGQTHTQRNREIEYVCVCAQAHAQTSSPYGISLCRIPLPAVIH
jgi:hypothetical protein